jgi:hypothetical protein
MSNVKRILVVLVCVAGLVAAAGLAAEAGRAQASSEQQKQPAQPTVVFLMEAFLVEVPSEQLYAAGVDPISMGGKAATTEVLSKCLAAKTAKVTAGLKALVLEGNEAELRDSQKMWISNRDKANPGNGTWSSYDAGTSIDLTPRPTGIGTLVAYRFSQSIPAEKADGPATVRNLNWTGVTLLKDATPTIVASQLDGDNAIFLVMCVKQVDLGSR